MPVAPRDECGQRDVDQGHGSDERRQRGENLAGPRRIDPARSAHKVEADGIRARIGRREGISPKLVEQMEEAEALTAANDTITLFIAFNYGGRAEILDAARGFTGTPEEEFRARLYAPDMHDPDLLIRTSGEQRISNYLLWQCAYSEFIFRDELWPDYSKEDFAATLEEFGHRKRRFGRRGES